MTRPVRTEGFFVEKDRLAHTAGFIEVFVVIFLETLHYDTEILEQLLGLRTVKIGTCDGLRAAIADDQTVSTVELVALGMTAKIVVIVEDKNFGVWPALLTIKERGGKSADAAADNDEIVRIGIGRRICPGFAVTHGMGDFPRTIMATTHAGLCRRIVTWLLFGSIGFVGIGQETSPEAARLYEGRTDRDTHTV